MPTITHKRRESMYFQAVATILAEEVTNANISYTTVTKVKLSNDGSHLFVFVSFISSPKRSLEELKKTAGFVRSRLSKFSNQRIVPHIHFEIDDTFEQGQRIENIIKSIKEK